MTLKITVQQPHKKPKTITTELLPGNGLLITLRKLWEVEQILNSLPGADLKVTVEIQ